MATSAIQLFPSLWRTWSKYVLDRVFVGERLRVSPFRLYAFVDRAAISRSAAS